jgi:hypothetical protein
MNQGVCRKKPRLKQINLMKKIAFNEEREICDLAIGRNNLKYVAA